jgi:predicted regulator of Ras-like GTPase activity (Roadblock/LC7/MglB family)
MQRSRDEAKSANRGQADLHTELLSAVRNALRRAEAIRGIAVSDASGLPIVDGFREKRDLLTVTAMAALIQRSGATVFQSLGYERPEYVVMHGTDADIVVQAVNPRATIIAVTDSGANIGLIHIVLRDLAKDLRALLRF